MKINLNENEYAFYAKYVFKPDPQVVSAGYIEIDTTGLTALKGRINKVILEIQNKIEFRQKKNLELGYTHSRLPDDHVYREELVQAQAILRKLLNAN